MATGKSVKGVKGGGRKPARRVQQNATELSAKKERAAFLVAEDKLTDEQIAAELEIDRSTLHRWKVAPGFKARVAQIVEEIKAAVVAKGIAERQNRIDAYNDRWNRMREVINQRAKAYADVSVGGNTGLIVRQVKGIGKGEDFQVVEEYAVDAALLREMREHEKQAAIELGEWTEKREHRFDFSNVSDEELKTLERITSKLT